MKKGKKYVEAASKIEKNKAYTKEAALEIIAQDAENGLISHEVLEALNKAVK